jgi:hypothetical protein
MPILLITETASRPFVDEGRVHLSPAVDLKIAVLGGHDEA